MLPWLTAPPAESLHDVREPSLAALVRDDMLRLILRGDLAPGQRINEPDVAARLQVSRVPVREALRSLESSGLVVARKHAGVFVRQLEPDEVRDLYELRALLDGHAGRRAALLPAVKRRRLLKQLDAAVAAMADAQQRHELQRYYVQNLQFHWAIVEAAGNGQLAETYRGIVQRLHLSRLKNLSQDVGMRASIREHAQIVQALRDGDAPRCEALMTRHVGDAWRRLAGEAPVEN